jgi:hypothetical protein
MRAYIPWARAYCKDEPLSMWNCKSATESDKQCFNGQKKNVIF